MHLNEAVRTVVARAIEDYRKNRDVKASLKIVVDAVVSEEIPFAYMDEAKEEFGLALEELISNEDGEVPDEWERISSKPLLDLLGVTSEHTETSIDTSGVKSGADIPIAEQTAP